MASSDAIAASGRVKIGEASRRRHLPFFYKLSFANKILAATLALLTLLGAAGTAGFQLVLRSRLHDEIASSSRVLAATAATQAAPALAGRTEEAMARVVEDLLRRDASVAYAMIVDRHGKVWAHTFPWDPPRELAQRTIDPAIDEGPYRQVDVDGRTCLEVSAPIRAGTQGLGVLRLGIGSERADRFVRDINVLFLAILFAVTLLGMLAARYYFRYVTRPVVELTHLADELSVGNLDVDFDFGVPVRCWEIKQCGRDDCAAYDNHTLQCWFVDGTPCEGYEPRFPQKLVGCRTCEVYRTHKGDEIVQLYDSFRHMARMLQTSRTDLERSDRFQRGLIRNSFDGIIATDETGVVRVFNRAAQNLTGYGESEVVGRMTWDQIFTSEVNRELRKPLLRDGSQQIFGFYSQEKEVRRKDGGAVDVRASGITLRDDGRQLGKVLFFQDLRELKRLREELIQKERLAATGQTVASISHSVKNILEGLRGGAYIYKRGIRIDDTDVRTKGWSMVERNIDLVSALVADLLNYARERTPDLEPMDPNALVSDVLKTLAPKAEAQGTKLESSLDPSAVPWSLDSHGMHQCLVNLVTNALDAAAAMDDGWVRVSTRVTDDDQLELRVEDNGPGIAPGLMDELFTSMVTTKGSRGTGLGLLVAHKIATEHGGTVAVDGTMAPGAAFRVFIPRRAAACESAPAADEAAASTA
ncbi:MAG: PAS domain S-box protein [Deltaproteobacteria bacterium]|nr:PAS domain S-box protein [Deltaproteobacteria bacterium]MBW2536938.1 PAS domain S-box protein [Deltaproteobacteria bacterium]